ncbi:PQQ-binding-like beta-propeller repeat protein [Anaerosolibacter sp.]|uniref:outer membrane protein assembly factor BamB family protein n=1 Tax=Anaerosolibacter sp. TaxID=1872527 RepID=UPI0039F0589D
MLYRKKKSVIAIVVLLLVLSSQGTSLAMGEDWTMYFKNERHTLEAEEGVEPQLSRAWNSEEGYFGYNSVVVSNNTVYGAEDTAGGKLYAFHLENGKKKWSSELDLDGRPNKSPLIVGDTLYVGTSTGALYAIKDQETSGQIVWKLRVQGGITGGIMYADNRIYFSTDQGKIYSISLNGSVLWNQQLSAEGLSTPTVANGLIYTTTADGYIYALDGETGNLEWEKRVYEGELSLDGDYHSVTAEGDRIFASTPDGRIVLLDGSRGKLMKDLETDHQIIGTIATDGEHLYGLNEEGALYSFSLTDGKELWKQDMGQNRGNASLSSPVISGSYLYLGKTGQGNKGGLIVVGAEDGKVIELHDLTNYGPGTPVVSNGHVIIGSQGSGLEVFRGKDVITETQPDGTIEQPDQSTTPGQSGNQSGSGQKKDKEPKSNHGQAVSATRRNSDKAVGEIQEVMENNRANISQGLLDQLITENKKLVLDSEQLQFKIPPGLLKKEELNINGSMQNLVVMIKENAEDYKNLVDATDMEYASVGKIIEFEFLNGTNEIKGFEAPLEVVIKVPPAALNGKKTNLLGVYYINDSTRSLEYMGGVFNPKDNTISFMTMHNSKYVIMEYNKEYKDTSNHWAKEDIKTLTAKHIISGVDSESFAPDKQITRAEFATILVKMLGLDTDIASTNTFDDIKEEQWYTSYVLAANKSGLVSGYDGKFRPNDPVSRQEMAVMIQNMLGLIDGNVDYDELVLEKFADKNNIDGWAKEAAVTMAQMGIIKGKNGMNFAPKDRASRAEAVTMLCRLLEKVQ